MSPTCENCGGHVSRQYVRVREPGGRDHARCCPNCEDKIRDGPDVREARSPRRSGPPDEAEQADDPTRSTDAVDFSRLAGSDGA